MEKIFTGALDDPRTKAEKNKDWQHEEIALTTAPVKWEEKTTFRTFPQKKQNGSGSCVAQTISKLLGINNFLESGIYVDLSAKYLYNHRSNSGAGMTPNDALSLAVSLGCPPEQLCRSQNQTEEEMNNCIKKPYITESSKIFAAQSYIRTPLDIDAIASVIESGKGLMTWFRFFRDEWNEYPEVKHEESAPNHHSVTAVDFTLYQGEKAIVIDDSWGEEYGINGQRIIRESFLKKRMTLSAYFIDMKNGCPTGNKPRYYGGKPEYGQRNDVVKNLQKVLKWAGFFKDVEPTGYYGGLTAKAVYNFQITNNVASKEELDSLAGMSVGPKTEAKLLELFG
jgi:hypothetical protein